MTLRHYGKFKNEEIVVLGYKKSMNTVMICRLTMLPADEQAALRQIASSAYAQSKCDYLVPILQNERHKSNQDWFTYLANRLQRHDGSVMILPLKEIEDMDPDQKAFFKGWGTSIEEARKVREEKAPELPDVDAPPGYEPITPLQSTEVPGQVPATAVEVPDISAEEAKPFVDREAMMLQLMQTMAEGQAKIAEGIANLDKKLSKPKRTVRRKPATKKATSKPAVDPVVEPQVEKPEPPAGRIE